MSKKNKRQKKVVTHVEPVIKSADPQQKDGPKKELNLAAPLLRIYAYLLDIGILLAIIFTTSRISGGFLWTSNSAPQDIAILLGYFLLPTALFGRTPGKWALGIKVIEMRGNPPGVLAIPREIFGRFVSVALVGVGLIWVLFDKKKQGWHDKLATTYVVYANKPFKDGSDSSGKSKKAT